MDAAGNQVSMTDALNHTTQFVYDNAGRRTQTIQTRRRIPSPMTRLAGRLRGRTRQAKSRNTAMTRSAG